MLAIKDPRIAPGMRALLAQRRARIAAGERPIGWKLGFGAPAARQKLQLDMPLIGYMMEASRVPSGGTVSLDGWIKPAAEPELAILVGIDLPPDPDDATVVTAIEAIAPAIELVDLEVPPDAIEPALARNIFHRHVVIGPQAEIRGARLDGLVAHVLRNGAETATTADLEGNTGPIIALVRHVADTLAAFGVHLAAGEFIIAGSIVPPVLLDANDTAFTNRVTALGDATVHFTHTPAPHPSAL